MDENVFTGDVKQDRETLQRDGINQYTDNTTTETEDDDGAGSVDSYKNRRNGNLDDTARAGSRHSLAGSRGGGLNSSRPNLMNADPLGGNPFTGRDTRDNTLNRTPSATLPPPPTDLLGGSGSSR